MIVSVKIEQRDLLADTRAVLAEGRAILNGKTLTFPEKAPFAGKGKLSVSEEGIRLVHQGETESETVLYFGKEGRTTVHSPFGDMFFSARLLNYEISPGRIELEYQIEQDESLAGWFRINAVYVAVS
jgi:hypothetical protein